MLAMPIYRALLFLIWLLLILVGLKIVEPVLVAIGETLRCGLAHGVA